VTSIREPRRIFAPSRGEPDAAGLANGPALERTLRAILPDLRNWMARFCGPGVDADDAAQDALIELASALAHFRGECSVRTYAYRIALRVASKHRAKRRALPELALVVEHAPDPESILEQRQALVRLYEALQQLSPAQRDAFVLCAIERVPHDEAALVLDIEVEALRARLKRARRELRAMLAHDALLGRFFGTEDVDDA
jgi:RNA polymerase sigma-70 factor, ECF subfamily